MRVVPAARSSACKDRLAGAGLASVAVVRDSAGWRCYSARIYRLAHTHRHYIGVSWKSSRGLEQRAQTTAAARPDVVGCESTIIGMPTPRTEIRYLHQIERNISGKIDLCDLYDLVWSV